MATDAIYINNSNNNNNNNNNDNNSDDDDNKTMPFKVSDKKLLKNYNKYGEK